MNQNLFNIDLFNNATPLFEQSSNDTKYLLENLIAENFNQISNNIKYVEQVKGSEINSNNYKITTNSGVYLAKKIINLENSDNINRVFSLNNWLTKKIKLSKIFLDNSKKFIVKNKSDNSFWSISSFIDGSYFTGKSNNELISVANEIGLFFSQLQHIPIDLYPIEKLNHFDKQNKTIEDIKKNKNKWNLYFGEELSFELKESWDSLENLYNILIKNKELIFSQELSPTHIDLHPHNILVSNNKIKSIIDMDSIKLDYDLVSISFSMYKLLKQTIITRDIKNDYDEISKVSNLYFNSLIKKFPIEEKENLFIYASTEIIRRILYIFSSNLYQNNNNWNHVLKVHLDGLKEAKIIFNCLNSVST